MPDDDERNPFERYDIDPMKGAAAITERMRELAEAAPDEPTRKAIRAAWEELTMHPARRLRAALGAHPDSHGAAGAPPPPPPVPRPPSLELSLSDLALRPSVVDTIGGDVGEALPDVPVERDPLLGE